MTDTRVTGSGIAVIGVIAVIAYSALAALQILVLNPWPRCPAGQLTRRAEARP